MTSLLQGLGRAFSKLSLFSSKSKFAKTSISTSSYLGKVRQFSLQPTAYRINGLRNFHQSSNLRFFNSVNQKSTDLGFKISKNPDYKIGAFTIASRLSTLASLDKEEIEKMSIVISQGVISAMNSFFNKQQNGEGIWYADEYSKYLMKTYKKEMDESFYSGYANENFFEKTGSFTFKLKEGKKASEAILSFLKGPTVADCANAAMSCYYKCVLDIIGEDNFNQLFDSNSKLPLIINQKRC